LLSRQELFKIVAEYDKHIKKNITEEGHYKHSNVNLQLAASVDLDEKMGRIQFLFDKIMDVNRGSLISRLRKESSFLSAY
jgi:hypothetical protein